MDNTNSHHMPYIDVRAVLLRSRARKFATEVKSSNMACTIPDEIIDWLKDEEIEEFREALKRFGLVQRKDFYWERKE